MQIRPFGGAVINANQHRLIPFTKTDKTLVTYLEKPEMDALLRQPDRYTVLGMRGYVLLLFLYNSGARADELARLTIGQLQLDDPPSVRIYGKGNKIRMRPLWPMMVTMLEKMVDGRAPTKSSSSAVRTNQ